MAFGLCFTFCCGLAVISQEKNILKDVFHILSVDDNTALMWIAVILSVNAAFNAIGRLGFSALSDRFKQRELSYILLLSMSVIITLLVVVTSSIDHGILWIVLPLLVFINAGYGGGFSTLPVLLHEHFGMKNVSTIHGLALSAWAIAGLTGNQLASLIVNTLGLSYNVVVITI